MSSKLPVFLATLLIGFSLSRIDLSRLHFSRIAFADDTDKKLEEIERKKDKLSDKLDDLTKDKNELEAKLTKLLNDLNATQEDINELSAKIASIEKQISEISAQLDIKREELSDKITLRNKILRTFYMDSPISDLDIFLTSLSINKTTNLSGFQKITNSYIAQKTLNHGTLSKISIINGDIAEYEKDKKNTENLKASLAVQKDKLLSLKATLDNQKEDVKEEISDLDNEIKKVNDSLSDLSSQQQELLREKFGATSEGITVGDYEKSSATLPDPSFKPAYAFFTYGYPHRVGASQYGMYGRAKAGQKYKDIIKAYFKDIEISGSCDKDKKISVKGYGSLKLEDTYLMGIAEVPESWASHGGYEALKAQVVLARTYALNYTEYYWEKGALKKRNSKVSICTTQSCQVYNGKKKTGAWKKAVEETCGQVVKWNGMPITAWYASTAGGFTRTPGQVWGSDRPWTKGIRDAKCTDVFDCSYDGPKYGNSPWFHKAWGKNNSTGNAWMKASEVEDMFNAYLLSNKNSKYNKNLSAPSKGGWSADKVEDELERLGIQPVGKVKNITMKDDGAGFTTSIVLTSDNYSNKSFDGYKFRSVFNLRSPGTLVIWTGYYDILIKD